jgi:hypothetical protein
VLGFGFILNKKMAVNIWVTVVDKDISRHLNSNDACSFDRHTFIALADYRQVKL